MDDPALASQEIVLATIGRNRLTLWLSGATKLSSDIVVSAFYFTGSA